MSEEDLNIAQALTAPTSSSIKACSARKLKNAQLTLSPRNKSRTSQNSRPGTVQGDFRIFASKLRLSLNKASESKS